MTTRLTNEFYSVLMASPATLGGVDNQPPKRKVARRFGHGLWATVISVATLVMGFLAIDFYNQYRDQENPLVQLANNGNTSSANAYLAGAVVCLLLTIFLAYMAVQHWRETGRS